MISALVSGRKRRSSGVPGPDFPRFGLGRRVLYIRRDLAPRASAIFESLARLNSDSQAGAGNRGSGFAFGLEGGPELFARQGRRGGWARWITRDLYFGATTRPLREL